MVRRLLAAYNFMGFVMILQWIERSLLLTELTVCAIILR